MTRLPDADLERLRAQMQKHGESQSQILHWAIDQYFWTRDAVGAQAVQSYIDASAGGADDSRAVSVRVGAEQARKLADERRRLGLSKSAILRLCVHVHLATWGYTDHQVTLSKPIK